MNVVLGLYYAPDQDPQVAAGVREEFVRALASYPTWAIHRAFDDWTSSMQRRPSPGDIVILVGKAMRPITDELARRERIATQETLATQQERVSPEAAAYILARAGFTPQRMDAMRAAPMAATFAEAETRKAEDQPRHWSETVAPDGPEMEALRRARAGNRMITEAVTFQQRGGSMMAGPDLKPELLPCPFCGGEPELYLGRGAYGVKCTCDGTAFIHTYNGGFVSNGIECEQAKLNAIAAWNGRATPPAPQETAGEAVVKKLDWQPIYGEDYAFEAKHPGQRGVSFLASDDEGKTYHQNAFEAEVRACLTHPTPTAAPTDNAALVRAVECERRHKSAYDALPQDRGGANGAKGKAYQLWMDARADVGNALARRPAEATSRERVEGTEAELRAWLKTARATNEQYRLQVVSRDARIEALTAERDAALTPKASDDGALVAALKAAERFIANGIEWGYITMPQKDTPDPAHNTLPMIRAALAEHKGGAS